MVGAVIQAIPSHKGMEGRAPLLRWTIGPHCAVTDDVAGSRSALVFLTRSPLSLSLSIKAR
jgi:hypothetical protein